ncbi:TPA: hypothetical protein JBA68_13550 [Legionella pneumophila]|nr:hypothetical protein [Legionella pneumophila]
MIAPYLYMPHASDENQASKPTDLVFILAIAGRIDAQSRILAQKLDKSRSIYYAYAVMDSLSSSYSMFKYFFDLFASPNDNDAMHEFLNSPAGLITIAVESVFLVTFSVLACQFENEKEDYYKKFIANAWPYFRDVMKGLKNAYKGWRSAVVAFSLIGGVDAKFLILPMGVILGVFAAANRFWIRSMLEDRKTMMSENIALLMEIKKLISLSHEESFSYFKRIRYQTMQTRNFAFWAVAAGGLLDGLYLYVGVLGLAVLSPQLLMAMALICAFYTVACVITRIYEEYDFQLRLLVTQTKCQLALITKELETNYAKLLLLQDKMDLDKVDQEELKRLKRLVHNLITRFDDSRKLLSQQSNRTYLSSALLGMKNGLYAYGALASVLFLVGSILVMAGVSFPPALLTACIILGLVLVLSFTIHSLVSNYWHQKKQETQKQRPYERLIEWNNCLNDEFNKTELLDPEEFHKLLNDGLSLDPSPQFFFQEWFEVLRSLFSGFGKGQKFIDFVGNSLQELGEDGHYRDTPVMYVLSAFSALLFGATLALRALAKGLGRTPLAQQAKLTEDSKEASVSPEIKKEVTQKTEEQRESIQSEKTRTDSPGHTDSLSLFGIFETKTKRNQPDSPSIPHSKSESALNQLTPSQNSTILGLA